MRLCVCVCVCVCFQIVGTTAQPLLHSAIFLCDPLPQPRFLSPLPVRTECYRDSNLSWFLQTLWLSEPILTQHATTISYPIGSMYAIYGSTMYAIYGSIYHQYTPVMLAYIPAPRILWVITTVLGCSQNVFPSESPSPKSRTCGRPKRFEPCSLHRSGCRLVGASCIDAPCCTHSWPI